MGRRKNRVQLTGFVDAATAKAIRQLANKAKVSQTDIVGALCELARRCRAGAVWPGETFVACRGAITAAAGWQDTIDEGEQPIAPMICFDVDSRQVRFVRQSSEVTAQGD
jgi:hypothetical protein